MMRTRTSPHCTVRQYEVPVAPLCSVVSSFEKSVTPNGKPERFMRTRLENRCPIMTSSRTVKKRRAYRAALDPCALLCHTCVRFESAGGLSMRIHHKLAVLVAACLIACPALAQPFAYVPNEKSGTVSIIDTTKDAVV